MQLNWDCFHSPCMIRQTWLCSHAPNTSTNWADLSRTFLNKYFPPGKTARLRTNITSFNHKKKNPYTKPRNISKTC